LRTGRNASRRQLESWGRRGEGSTCQGSSHPPNPCFYTSRGDEPSEMSSIFQALERAKTFSQLRKIDLPSLPLKQTNKRRTFSMSNPCSSSPPSSLQFFIPERELISRVCMHMLCVNPLLLKSPVSSSCVELDASGEKVRSKQTIIHSKGSRFPAGRHSWKSHVLAASMCTDEVFQMSEGKSASEGEWKNGFRDASRPS